MDLPAEVQIHNEILGVKGAKGTLVAVQNGFYETTCVFGGNRHRVLLPISQTVLVFRQPEPEFPAGIEIER